MINIYKAGTKYKNENGVCYDIKTINGADKSKYTIKGWVTSLDLIDEIEDAVFEEIKEEKPKAKRKSKKAS
ncbi:MAG: hypothetical protein CMJ25_13655 [Phycisphaerae bacterium]|nr:hypothetical protein [Phycisphaerae bacterium]|tara:strand:- start:4409 stop:4621 length:213 start_codon:yes stop_codon:yes gene_type:complete